MTQTPATAVQRDYGSVLLSPVVTLTWLTKGSGAMCWRLPSVCVSIHPSLDGVARLRASILVSVARTHRVMPHRSRDASFTCSRALHRPSLAPQAMGIYVPTTGVEGERVTWSRGTMTRPVEWRCAIYLSYGPHMRARDLVIFAVLGHEGPSGHDQFFPATPPTTHFVQWRPLSSRRRGSLLPTVSSRLS